MPHSSDIDSSTMMEEIPEHWLATIAHYVMGFRNDTVDFSAPILRPVAVKLYPLFIIQYGILALFGIITNIAIMFYVMRYKLYHDVTHAFLMNLAFCHFVQCAIVLPITLMVLLIQNWIFGQFMCFFLPLLQDIPLHVAMISHLLIAWDRMRWLGDPLKTRLPAFVCSCASWLTGMVIALPYPIYTTYLDLGLYLKHFRGVGFCAVNLVDDMQEYMRGLFIIMYCAPMTVLAYLFIRTSRELRPPDGPLAVMMFEARADARNKQRTSSSSTGRTARSSRSYDLYDAELDVNREKRTQRYLGAMAATQVICVCPLMVLRLARMALVETYENTAHFDLTYLMFVWMAFLPTAIIPWIYASWVLSRPAKERLRGYFRLSSRRNNNKLGPRRSCEDSLTQDMTTEISNVQTSSNNVPETTNSSIKTAHVNVISDLKETNKNVDNYFQPLKASNKFSQQNASLEPISNSCSNITSSTYCNNGTDKDNSDFENASSIYTEKGSSYYDRKPLCDKGNFYRLPNNGSDKRRFGNRKPSFLDTTSIVSNFSGQGSTSTLERDLEIIDLLERERSMDIQEMLEQERKTSLMKKSTHRQNSMPLTEPQYSHRKLPPEPPMITNKLDRITYVNGPLTHKEMDTFSKFSSNFGSTRERHSIESAENPLLGNLSRKSSSHSSKRSSTTSVTDVIYEPPIVPNAEQRIRRARGSSSSKSSSTKSRGDTRFNNSSSIKEYMS